MLSLLAMRYKGRNNRTVGVNIPRIISLRGNLKWGKGVGNGEGASRDFRGDGLHW